VPLDEIQLRFLQDHVLRRKLQALDLASDTIPPPSGGSKGALERAANAVRFLDMLRALVTPPKANKEESALLDNYRVAIREHLKDPVTEAGLLEANQSLQAMDAAINTCRQRISSDERSKLMQGIAEALLSVDPEVMEPEQSRIPIDADSIRTNLPELPSDDALMEARLALNALNTLIQQANVRVLDARKERAELKLALLKGMADAKLSDEATSDEVRQGSELSGKVNSLLIADPPTTDALQQAKEALDSWVDFVNKVNQDISAVRKVRFALAKAADEKFCKLPVALPSNCPNDKSGLIKMREVLAQDLQPFLDWARVTTWDTPALEQIDHRIEQLGQQFINLQQELDNALEAIRIASEAAAQAIDNPKDGALSLTQKSHFENVLKMALDTARQNPLEATPQIEHMTALLKQVATVARVRKDLLKRLGMVPLPPPAAATLQEQARWGQLREAAVRAADEVLDT
jgi:hypothetical protein